MSASLTIVEQLAPSSSSALSSVTPFLAAMLGATVAATTAYLLQKRQFRQQQAILDRDRSEQEETTGLGVLLRINRVLTTVTRIREHIDQGLTRSRRPGRLDLWAKTEEFSSAFPKVEVSIEELTFVKRLNDVVALDVMMDIQEMNGTYTETISRYGELRAKLSERMTGMATLRTDGAAVIADFTPEQMQVLAPEMERLNKLLLDLHALAARDEPVLLDLFRRVQRLAQAKLGDRAVAFEIPEPSDHAKAAEIDCDLASGTEAQGTSE